jgi:hypothetical protein
MLAGRATVGSCSPGDGGGGLRRNGGFVCTADVRPCRAAGLLPPFGSAQAGRMMPPWATHL